MQASMILRHEGDRTLTLDIHPTPDDFPRHVLTLTIRQPNAAPVAWTLDDSERSALLGFLAAVPMVDPNLGTPDDPRVMLADHEHRHHGAPSTGLRSFAPAPAARLAEVVRQFGGLSFGPVEALQTMFRDDGHEFTPEERVSLPMLRSLVDASLATVELRGGGEVWDITEDGKAALIARGEN